VGAEKRGETRKEGKVLEETERNGKQERRRGQKEKEHMEEDEEKGKSLLLHASQRLRARIIGFIQA
jgi:hypothetical protein